MKTVNDRSKLTLHEIIKQVILPGSIVMTDKWKAYTGIDKIPGMRLTHLIVNHSRNFVDPTTGANTQSIESQWNQLKRANKRRCGTDRRMISSYLKEYIYRKKFKKEDLFDQILSDIAHFYPPSQ